MRKAMLAACTLFLLGATLTGADGPTPMVRTVDPSPAHCGTRIVAKGEYLGKLVVKSIFLSTKDENNEVQLLSQDDNTITFKVPSDLKPGRYSVVVMTAGPAPQLIEEPSYLTVE